MSTTIDERVVEMRFDNKQFESNVSTSMSTLKKLKESLKFTGATKGLEEIDAASKRVNMSGLGGAVDSVKAKFSAMDVVAVTALANITNSAVNAGKRLISSLSVDQISAGWQKFGDKTTSVATLVAQGNAIEDVNKQLDLLNWFTDETSYNFTDMVSNIAKFTASGKGLEESVTAMEGIATWAALSGQNAMTASRAMYQLSQAMGAGVMRREDYRSIQNASMDTKEFRQNCLDAAVALGTLKDNGDGTYTSIVEGAKQSSFTISQFADNLTEGMWLTSDVMMSVYTKYASAVNGIYEAVEEKGFDNASQVLTEIHDKADQLKDGVMTDDEAIDAAIKELGYTLEDGSLKFDHFGVKAFEAAQQARTFTDVIDSVKDAVSTGWMNTFEKIFGDSEQATKMWTMMANELWTTFAGGGERRNNILDQAMGSGWDKLSERITDAGIEIDVFEAKVKECAKAGGADVASLIKKYGSLSDVFKNGALDTDYLKKALETISENAEGASVEIDDLLDSLSRPSGRELIFDTIKNSLQVVNGILGAFRDAWAEVFSEEGVASGLYNGLKAVKDFTDGFFELDKEGNRVLKNVDKIKSTFKGLIAVLDIIASIVGGAVKFAFQVLGVIFGNFNLNVLDATAGVGDFLVMLSDMIKEGEYIGKAFGWLLDKVTTAVKTLKKWIDRLFSGVKKSNAFRTIERAFQKLSIAFKLFREGKIGTTELAVAVKKFLGVINDTITPIKNLTDTIGRWFEAFKNLSSVQAFIEAVNDISDAFSKFFNGEFDSDELGAALGTAFANILSSIPSIIKEVASGLWNAATQIASDFLAGFQNGIENGISGIIGDIVEFCLSFVSSFAEALGVQSPSWKAYEIAVDFFQGAINGINDMLQPVLEALKPIGEGILKVFRSFWGYVTDENGDVEWGKIISGGITISSLVILNKFAKALDKFASAATSFSGIISGVTGVLTQLKESIKSLGKSIELDFKADALMKLAISLGILMASIWLLSQVDDYGKLWNAVGIIAVLTVILFSLSWAIDKLSAASIKWDKGPQIEGIKSGLIQIGLALLLVAAVVKIVGSIPEPEAKRGFAGVAAITVGMMVFLAVIGKVSKYAGDVGSFAKTMVSLSVALLLMTLVIKMIAKLDPGDILVGLVVMEAFALFCIQLGVSNRIAGQYDSGSTFMKLAISLGIMVIVMKMIRKLDPDDILKGLVVMELFTLLLIEMGIANRIAGGTSGKFGGTVASMAFSMLIMAGVLKVLAKLDPEDVKNGISVMQKFILLIAEMILISKLAGKESAKIAGNILAMAIAIGILAGVVYLLTMFEDVDMKKPLAVIAALGLVMSAMTWASRGASNVRQNIVALTTTIGVMAAAIIALSFVDGKDLAKATIALGSLMLLFALMTKASQGAEITLKNAGAIVLLLGVVLALGGVVFALSLIDSKNTVSNAIALGILLTALTASLWVISKSKSVLKTVARQLGSLTLVVAGLAVILAALSFLPDASMMIPNAIALGILLNALAASLVVMSKAKSISKSVAAQLGPIYLVTLGLSAILAALSFLPDASMMIPNAIAVGILLNEFAASLVVLDQAKSISKSVAAQLGPMYLVTLGLAAILAALSFLPDASMMIPNAIALGILLNALAAAMVILGYAGPNAAEAVPAAMLMGIVVGELAIVLGIMAALNLEVSIGTAASLSVLLIALSLACKIVSGIPLSGAVKGALGLAAFIGILGILVAAIGGLASITGAMDVLKNAVEALGLIGTAIGNFIGGILGGVITGIGSAVLSLLPQLGVALSMFMVGATPFITLAKTVDSSVIAGAGYLAAAILVLSAANFISGVTSILTLGQSSFASLGVQLLMFGIGVKAFSDTISGIDASSIEAASNIVNMILTLTASEFISGIMELFGGGINFEALGTKLTSFGDAVVSFSNTISGKIDTDAVQAATSAGELLVALNESLPRSGGWVQDIIGEQDFGKFASACNAFATCILEINNTLSQSGFEIQSEKIEQLVTAGTQFSDLNNALPRSGGIAQDLAGEQDLSKFGEACAAFARCLISINDALSQDGLVIQSDKLKQLANAGAQFSDLSNALPRSGGIAQDLAGEKDLSKFGLACTAFATCMIGVNAAVSQEGFSVNLEAIDQLKQAGDKMNELQDSLPKSGGWWQDIAGASDIGDFGTKISTFATAIVDFSTNATGLNTGAIDTALSTAEQIKEFISDLVGMDFSGVADFTGVGGGWPGADGPVYDIGKAISKFSSSLNGINTENIAVATDAAEKLKDLISGLVGFDTSGAELFKPETIGTAIKSYSDNISDIDIEKISTSITCANRLKTFISGLIDLDSSGVTNFTPESIGGALLAYNTQIAGIDNAKISSTIAISNRLKTLISELADLNDSGVAKFKIMPIATNLKSYSASVAGVNESAVSSSVSAATKLKTFIADLAGLDTSGVETFKAAVASLSTLSIEPHVESLSVASESLYTSGTAMIGMLAKAFDEGNSKVSTSATGVITNAKTKIESKKGDFKTAGKTLVTSFASGISNDSSTASSRAGTMAYDAGVKASNSGYSKFYDAGTYCVQGFAYGIEIKTYIVEDIAYKMGEKAAEAAKKAIDSNSPSKVFMKIGTYVPQGFAIGIGSLSDKVEGAATKMAKTAINGTRSAVTTLLDTLNTDMDMQPTIRPVVDLSDVRTGAAAVSGIFGNVQMVGVRSNLNAINLAMNARSQNGANDDIISAINKLGAGLENNRGDTYNFGDFTYDDGSNVADAVGTLIRYAKIGRRV